MRLHLHDMRSMRFSRSGGMQAWRYNGGQSVLLGSASTTVQALEEGPNSGLHLQLSGGKVRALKAFCHPAWFHASSGTALASTLAIIR